VTAWKYLIYLRDILTYCVFTTAISISSDIKLNADCVDSEMGYH